VCGNYGKTVRVNGNYAAAGPGIPIFSFFGYDRFLNLPPAPPDNISAIKAKVFTDTPGSKFGCVDFFQMVKQVIAHKSAGHH